MSASLAIAATSIHGPHIAWAGLSPVLVLTAGGLVVLLVGLLRSGFARTQVVPGLTLVTLAGTIGTEIWRFNHTETIIAGALRIDDLGLIIGLVCAVSAIATVMMSWRHVAAREAGHGEYHALLLFSTLGMLVLGSAYDIVALFIGFELLSIPLYVLCATEYRREGSLESGLKYLIIGSIGSGCLVYGLAMIYGATGQTGFAQIAHVLAGGLGTNVLSDPLLLTGLALVIAGFAFKSSIAPFHQWTPDVYEGAPTPITSFMMTATKAAAFAVFLRFFMIPVISDQAKWAPALAALAAISIIAGNVGALGQTSLKRMLGYSGVAHAGYMLCGLVVGTRLGVSSTVLYLVFYLFMNIAGFAVVQAVEADTGSDRVSGLAGLKDRSPALAWSMTISMLALAGIPGTVGFVGKFRLIDALVDGHFAWLAIVLVVGAMISLGYYLRVVAAVWMSRGQPTTSGNIESPGLPALAGGAAVNPAVGTAGAAGSAGGMPPIAGGMPPIAGGSPEADRWPHWELLVVAVVMGAACVVFGIIPSPVFTLAGHAGAAIPGLIP